MAGNSIGIAAYLAGNLAGLMTWALVLSVYPCITLCVNIPLGICLIHSGN